MLKWKALERHESNPWTHQRLFFLGPRELWKSRAIVGQQKATPERNGVSIFEIKFHRNCNRKTPIFAAYRHIWGRCRAWMCLPGILVSDFRVRRWYVSIALPFHAVWQANSATTHVFSMSRRSFYSQALPNSLCECISRGRQSAGKRSSQILISKK